MSSPPSVFPKSPSNQLLSCLNRTRNRLNLQKLSFMPGVEISCRIKNTFTSLRNAARTSCLCAANPSAQKLHFTLKELIALDRQIDHYKDQIQELIDKLDESSTLTNKLKEVHSKLSTVQLYPKHRSEISNIEHEAQKIINMAKDHLNKTPSNPKQNQNGEGHSDWALSSPEQDEGQIEDCLSKILKEKWKQQSPEECQKHINNLFEDMGDKSTTIELHPKGDSVEAISLLEEMTPVFRDLMLIRNQYFENMNEKETAFKTKTQAESLIERAQVYLNERDSLNASGDAPGATNDVHLAHVSAAERQRPFRFK
ncbi:MAG: hypothetical protein P8144_06990 [Gammaproteobacteria bacterium]